MEMIMIEKRVYDSMVAKLEALAGRIEALNEKQQKRLGHWLDNEEVCEMLSIAKRTLQAYREKGSFLTRKSDIKSTISRKT